MILFALFLKSDFYMIVVLSFFQFHFALLFKSKD